jgi:subtilisin family serine protease
MSKRKKTPGYTSATYEYPRAADYVIAELRYGSRVVVSRRGFVAPVAAEPVARGMNEMLGAFDIRRIAPHFDVSERTLATRATAIPARARPSTEFAQSGFVQVVPRNPKDAPRIVARLARSKAVWNAYVAPRPVPAAAPDGASTTSRNFEPAQGYLHSAPDGIGAMEVWPLPGGKGRGVTVCDIEGNWNYSHEDLPARIPLLGGTPIPQLSWRNHGTAVLGEILSKPGTSGTVGIAHEARGATHSAVINNVFNTAGAIMGAAANLKAGDVILIELQATGPNGRYVAMQFWDDVFSAIRAATMKGITVVEAAGNGDENFDLATFNGTGLQRDSGAIVVGAGVPPTNLFDFFGFGGGGGYTKIGVPRSRIWFSNYGRIVNVHGWGWHVTTCGYGDAQGSTSENRWYTHRFSGTSSASPIVTGGVAVLQGIAKARRGAPLTPARVRDILMRTGTPQVAGPSAPLSQRIGPLPNLAQAVRVV